MVFLACYALAIVNVLNCNPTYEWENATIVKTICLPCQVVQIKLGCVTRIKLGQ